MSRGASQHLRQIHQQQQNEKPTDYKRKKLEVAPIICFTVGGPFSQNPETTFLLGPGGMQVEHHAASAPRCRGAGDQRCVEMIT